MKLNVRNHYIVIWISCLCFFSAMIGCRGKREVNRVDSIEKLYQQMEQLSADSPEKVNRMVDTLLPSVTDSMMYYRLLFLKVRNCFLSFKLDSADYFMDRISSFCDRHQGSQEIA